MPISNQIKWEPDNCEGAIVDKKQDSVGCTPARCLEFNMHVIYDEWGTHSQLIAAAQKAH